MSWRNAIDQRISQLTSVAQNVIKDTFSLSAVPKEALYIGLAGVVPYLGTSLSTAYLAWEMNNQASLGSGYVLSGDTASLLLHIIEPVQVGYGAVVSYSTHGRDEMQDAKGTFSDAVLLGCDPLGS